MVSVEKEKGIALVTGGAQRLGKSICLFLAHYGYDIVIHYWKSEEEALLLSKQIETFGRKCYVFKADLLDEVEMLELIPRISKKISGKLNLLINNASIFEYDNYGNASIDSWNRHINSNLKAPFFLTQSFSKQIPDPYCNDNGEFYANANVINIVDQRVKKPTPQFITYSLAKMALMSLTITSAQALCPGIRVNAIGPGPTLQGKRQSDDHYDTQRKSTILGRGASPDEISNTIKYYLESPGVTGQVICVDGGQHLAWQTKDVLGVE